MYEMRQNLNIFFNLNVFEKTVPIIFFNSLLNIELTVSIKTGHLCHADLNVVQ